MTTKRLPRQSGPQTSTILSIRHPETEAGSLILSIVGGLRRDLDKTAPRQTIELLASTMEAVAERSYQDDAQPPPSDFLAMFRLVDYICRTNGDVWQTIDVPGQILVKPIHISCDDAGAQKVWEELWYETLDIDDLFDEVFYQLEQNANVFPLEIWDNGDIKAIVFLEPTSMWVGRHYNDYGLLGPQGFEVAKLKDSIHPLAYTSFVTDQNIQTSRWYRIPIKPDCMTPIHGRKMKYQRYAIPNVVRASRNVLHRQILDELRRGTMEGFINQLILLTVGSDHLSPKVNQDLISRTNTLMGSQSKERTGLVVLHHTAKAQVVTPNPLSDLLGDRSYMELTQAIMRDLGFSLFLIDGEIPGSSGKGGGSQVDMDLQFNIERWHYKRRRILKWCKLFSKKFGERRNDDALLKHLPVFTIDPIGVEQTMAIKEKIIPLATGGHLSEHTTLEQSGVSTYERELAFKKQEKPTAELWLPKPTFNQMATNSEGEQTEKRSSSLGRPPANQTRGNLIEGSDWEIDTHFRAILDGKKSHIETFIDWLDTTIKIELTTAYQDGFRAWGGLGDLSNQILADAPQGIPFQQERLRMFGEELLKSDPAHLIDFRPRALMYADAAHIAYMLGVQQAMKSHGSTHWQRLLHPELSVTGPCSQCLADAAVVHPITEPFFEPHPAGVCGVQSLNFHFTSRPPQAVEIPKWGVPTQHMVRRWPMQ